MRTEKITAERLTENIQKRIDIQNTQPERFNARLNLQLEEVNTEANIKAVFGFNVGEWCLNPYGDVHGGVVASILDTSMGLGAAGICESNVNTTDMTVSYLSAMNTHKFYICCEYTKIGRRMIRCISRAEDKHGKVYATAMASFMVMGDEKTVG